MGRDVGVGMNLTLLVWTQLLTLLFLGSQQWETLIMFLPYIMQNIVFV